MADRLFGLLLLQKFRGFVEFTQGVSWSFEVEHRNGAGIEELFLYFAALSPLLFLLAKIFFRNSNRGDLSPLVVAPDFPCRFVPGGGIVCSCGTLCFYGGPPGND